MLGLHHRNRPQPPAQPLETAIPVGAQGANINKVLINRVLLVVTLLPKHMTYLSMWIGREGGRSFPDVSGAFRKCLWC